MPIRLSSAISNYVLNAGSIAEALSGGVLKIYTGEQPDSADRAPTGTLLATITDNAGAHTPEVQAVGSITRTSGDGSITAITVDGVNILDATATVTGGLFQLLDKLAASRLNNDFLFAWDGADTISVLGRPGRGSRLNGKAISGSASGVTLSFEAMAGGSDAVNGLLLGSLYYSWGLRTPYVAKRQAQTWKGVAAAAGTAGWFRFESPLGDDGLDDVNYLQCRMDGSIGTSDANMIMANTTFAVSDEIVLVTFAPGAVPGPEL